MQLKKAHALFLSLVLAVIVTPGCRSTIQLPKFASVENVVDLRVDDSLSDVIKTLGSEPYNVYMNQRDGYTIYLYKYKLVERQVRPKWANTRGGETTGREVYHGKEHTLYLFFKEGKLDSYITTDGRKEGETLIMQKNTLEAITISKGKYFIDPLLQLNEPTKNQMNPLNLKKKRFLFF